MATDAALAHARVVCRECLGAGIKYNNVKCPTCERVATLIDAAVQRGREEGARAERNWLRPFIKDHPLCAFVYDGSKCNCGLDAVLGADPR